MTDKEKTIEDEPQIIVDLSGVNKDIKELKQMIAEAMPKTEPKGIVENKTQDAKTFKKMFKEYLQTGFWKGQTLSESIGAQTASSAIPALWSSELEILQPDGADGFFLSNVVTWKDEVTGKPGNTVYVQTVAPVAAVTISSGTEPSPTAATVTSVPVTLVQTGHGFLITKADLEDIQDGTMDAIIEQSKKSIMRALDGTFLQRIQASDNNCRAGTITGTSKMAGTWLAKLWGSLMAGSYTPATVVMHPVPFASLLQDSQFVNAATYGDATVIRDAKIPKYLGMDIVPLVQNGGTLLNYGGTAGTYKTYMFAKGVMVGAIKRQMEIEKQYWVPTQSNYVMSTIRFGGTVVHTYGIGLLTTLDP
jgi:hypothetical protein